MSSPETSLPTLSEQQDVEYPIAKIMPQASRGPQDIVSLALTPKQVTQQITLIQRVMKDHMKVDEHYGVIPGTKKPTLYQAGAQKLAMLFRLDVRPTVTYRIIEEDFIFYEVRVDVYHIPTGLHISGWMGSCSSREEKYAFRHAARRCSECAVEAIIQGKPEYAPDKPGYDRGGFVCFKKKGGCGKMFRDDDPAITSQSLGKVKNENIWELHNTILKIAVKRAAISAVLYSTAASDIFTVDLDDLPPEFSDEPAPAQMRVGPATVPPPLPSQTRRKATPPARPEVIPPGEEQPRKATAQPPEPPASPAPVPIAPEAPASNQAKSLEITKRSGCNQTALIGFVRDMVRKCIKKPDWDLPPKTDAQRGLVSQVLDVLVAGLERIPSASIGAFIHGQPISEAERAIMQEVWKAKVK